MFLIVTIFLLLMIFLLIPDNFHHRRRRHPSQPEEHRPAPNIGIIVNRELKPDDRLLAHGDKPSKEEVEVITFYRGRVVPAFSRRE